jgi:hypothetical protein
MSTSRVLAVVALILVAVLAVVGLMGSLNIISLLLYVAIGLLAVAILVHSGG